MATRQDDRYQLKWRPLVTALVLLVAVAGSSHGQTRCPNRCRCSGEDADCSNSRLSTPPRSYPEGTRSINIEGNHIRVLGSRSFGHLPDIETLKAAKNRIRRLNNDVFRILLPNLVTLDLSRNRIRRIASNALRGMNALNTLDLSRNQISSLRRIFHGAPNLYQIRLTQNLISRIGENDLAPLTNVHSVDLKANQISNIHPRAFSQLTRLRYLYLQHNPIGRMPAMQFGTEVLQMVDLSYDQLTAVPTPFPASTREMRLDHNLVEQVNHTDFLSIENLQMITMNDNKLSFFADSALAHMTNLREVWMRNNEMVYIPRNLPDTVVRIDLKSNSIGQIEVGLFRETSQLAILSVQSNQITSIQPDTFSPLQFLQSLDFQGNQLGVLQGNTFVNLGSLLTLKLSNNPLQRIDNGAFRNLANLTTLTLSYIEAEEFELAYNFLPEMPKLKKLQLYASPGLSQSLMEKVQEGDLTPMSDMEVLDVSHSNLVSVPSRVREVFPNLRSFYLDGNPWRCTQSLRWLKEWIVEQATSVRFYQQMEPTCDSPSRLRDRPLTSLLDEEWAADDEQDYPTLPEGGAWDPSRTHGETVNDQPQGQRMRESEKESGLLGTLLEMGHSDQNEAKDLQNVKKVEVKVRPLSMILARPGGVRNTQDEGVGKGKATKPKGKKGKKGKNRRQGRKGRKGRGKKRGKKERKNRKNRKSRERKRRRRITINTSTSRKEKAKASQ